MCCPLLGRQKRYLNNDMSNIITYQLIINSHKYEFNPKKRAHFILIGLRRSEEHFLSNTQYIYIYAFTTQKHVFPIT